MVSSRDFSSEIAAQRTFVAKTSHIAKQSNFQSSIIHFTYDHITPIFCTATSYIMIFNFHFNPRHTGDQETKQYIRNIGNRFTSNYSEFSKELCLLTIFSEVLICVSRFIILFSILILIETLTK